MTHLSQNQLTSLGWKLQRTESTSRATGRKQMRVLGSRKRFLLPTVIAYMYGKNYFIRHCAIDKTILSGLSSQFCWSEFSVLLMCSCQRYHTLTHETARICISVHNYTGESKEVCMFLCLLIWILHVFCQLMDVASQDTNLSIRNTFITQGLVPH